MLALLEEVRLKVKSWAILLISSKTTVKYFPHLPCCYILQWIWQHRNPELLNSELLNVEDTAVTLKLDFVINWKNTVVESENVVQGPEVVLELRNKRKDHGLWKRG